MKGLLNKQQRIFKPLSKVLKRIINRHSLSSRQSCFAEYLWEFESLNLINTDFVSPQASEEVLLIIAKIPKIL